MPTRFYRLLRVCSALAISLAIVAHAAADLYDPPTDYYAAATGTGATLKSQLTTIMSTGHVLRSYGDFKYSAAITDRDPNNANNILLVYNRASVNSDWDSGDTWNREHLWPDSRQPGNASDGATGAIADPFMLRPSNPSINSARGNDPYGFDNTTGSYGPVSSSYYYPGDADAGDVARALFYAATRWAGTLSLTDSAPSGNQMGDLSSLLHWHYRDTPDDFERRRNQYIYSQSLNPNYYTNNRNAYIDRPEFVWSVFVDQLNDTQLHLGSTVNTDGSSTVNVDLGRIIKGAAAPTQNVTLAKTGNDGTYYQVTTTGNATSSVTGRYNAFEMDGAGSRTLTLGLNVNTNVAGNYSGAVTVDNLDVTTQYGNGHGAQDGDDVANVSLAVLEHANASFVSNSDVNTLNIDFGPITRNVTNPSAAFSVFNRGAVAALTAGLDYDGVSTSGNAGRFTLGGLAFAALAAGSSDAATIALKTNTLGTFSAVFTLQLSDEDVPGATAQTITLNVTGSVLAPLSGDANNDGLVDAADYRFVETYFGTTGTSNGTLLGDANDDGRVDGADVLAVDRNFGSAYAGLSVPEPGTGIVVMIGVGLVLRRRRRSGWTG